MRTVAFIPVRGGSKSIPLKNIRPIAGKPLVQWTIEAAVNCKNIDHVYVATDSEEIKSVVNAMAFDKVSVIGRSAESATDTASSESVLLEFAEKYNFDHIIFIQATSPLLQTLDLENGFGKYLYGKYDSLLSVVRQKRFIWEEMDGKATPVNYDPLNRPRRQEFSGFLVENGAFYITTRQQLIKEKCRISGNIGCYEMDETSYLEIDEFTDWEIIEKILMEKNDANNELFQKLKQIKLLITDCDGVLTDGGMYYSESGDELKKFNTKDGMGISILKEQGIIVAIITGEDVELVKKRARKMNVDEVHCGVKNKLEVYLKLIEKYDLNEQQVAYIGDDINDAEVMRRVGVPISVNDGMNQVKEIARYVTKKNGGEGAVREVCELILNAMKHGII